MLKRTVVLVVMVFGLLSAFQLTGCQRNQSGSNNLLSDVQSRDKLIVGVKYDSPPFGFMDEKGELQGMEIELTRNIAKALLGDENKVEFVQVQSSTRIPALQARQVDMIMATMTITPERAKVVNFTEPYYHAKQDFMVKSDSPYHKAQDLAGKTIIFVIGSTGEQNLRKLLPTAQLKGFKSSTEAFSAFYAGRADAFSTDDSILNGFLSEHCGLRLLGEEVSDEPYGVVFRKDDVSKPLQDEVQNILNNLNTDGTLDNLAEKWTKSQPAQCKNE